MKPTLLLLAISHVLLSACAQTSEKQPVVAAVSESGCEGCAAIYESPLAFEKLGWQIQLPAAEGGGTPLHITGTVFQPDGKTPAAGVVLYVYHTNAGGRYPAKEDAAGWGRRHGYLRGWMRTNEMGQYSFETIKPGSYPGSTEPAHIHIIVKEKDKPEYYIDDIVFDDDPFLDQRHLSRLRQYGGSGIVRLSDTNNTFIGRRDIILGKNITAQ